MKNVTTESTGHFFGATNGVINLVLWENIVFDTCNGTGTNFTSLFRIGSGGYNNVTINNVYAINTNASYGYFSEGMGGSVLTMDRWILCLY